MFSWYLSNYTLIILCMKLININSAVKYIQYKEIQSYKIFSIAIVVVSNLTTLVRQLYLNITVVLVEKVSVQVVLNGECLFLGEIGALIL